MPSLSKQEARLLARCVERFKESFERDVADVLAAHFHGARPVEISETLEGLTLLLRQLDAEKAPRDIEVHDSQKRLIRRVVVEERRRAAEEIEAPIQRATDPELLRHLHRKLRPLEQLMQTEWFRDGEAQRVPRLTDYISVRYAEQVLPSLRALEPREFDEKFHILEAPRLFLPDLAYYRQHCGLRAAPLTVAFADIDDFKDFNTRHGETRVDRDILTPFMEALEAHLFGRGHVYRFGGDEYVMLLPNADEDWAKQIVESLQARLAALSYRGVDEHPTISVGLCVLDDDSILTDREAQEAANRAKAFAKVHRKGAIASFGGPLYRDQDLRLL